MLRLDCIAQNYAWGRTPQQDSEVAALEQAAGKSVDPSKPYAELWMGTHSSGLSTVAKDPNISLKDWILSHPESLGEDVQQRFGSDLPFLFKVLSVSTALSIQSHPDKNLAERLHAERPKVYKDDNHKPEMTVAISDFEALCGFVSADELAQVLAKYPELQPCLGAGATAEPQTPGTSGRTQENGKTGKSQCMSESTIKNSLGASDRSIGEAGSSNEGGQEGQKLQLKRLFTALMTSDSTKVATAIDNLQQRFVSESSTSKLTSKERLIMRLNKQYPGDVGVLAAFFLNYISLKAGQSIYLAANVPHAYISGQLVECMATSDNVIRAGLTPKLRDTEVLCESLTYEQGLPTVLEGDEVQQYTQVFSPPFEEFEIYRVQIPAGKHTLIPSNNGPTVLLVQRGDGTVMCRPSVSDPLLQEAPRLSMGCVFFIPAKSSLAIYAEEQDLQIWIAAVNSKVFASQFQMPQPAEQILQAA